jgi:hypothetical protein
MLSTEKNKMMNLNTFPNMTENNVHRFITILSIFITCWVIYIQKGWISVDSLFYFEVARLFSVGEWQAGIALYSLPLYPLLIAGLHGITTLDFQLCAQILTVIFFAITTYSLLRIVLLAGGDKLALILAALLLFSTTYIVGDILPMLVRDQGFWAFLLTALVYFIKYYRYHNTKDAIYWQLFALIAMLFRIEAATFIALLPLALLYMPRVKTGQKIRYLFTAYALNIALVICLIFALFLHGSINLKQLGRLNEIVNSFTEIQKNFSVEITAKASAMAKDVLGEPLAGFAWMGLLMALISIAAIKCLTVANILPLLLAGVGYNKLKQNMADDVRYLVMAAALIVFLNAVLIIFKVNLLSSRYVIIFGFMLIIFATFAAHAMINGIKFKQLSILNKVIAAIALLIISWGIISNVRPKNEGYNYEQEAVTYVKNLTSSQNGKVFYTSRRARYYAGESYIKPNPPNQWDFLQLAIAEESIYKYDYLVINLNADEVSAGKEQVLAKQLPQYKLIHTTYGFKKKKRVLIYKKVN